MNYSSNKPAALPPPALRAAAQGLEGRLALRLSSHLSRSADALPHDVMERLRFGRERAIEVARQRLQVAAGATALGAGPTAVLGARPSLWLRMVSAVPLLMLVAGLVLIQHHHEFEQIAVAAEIDSALLADELPPSAYGDPGFSEFLRTAAP